MIRTYKYKLKLTVKQQKLLERFFGCVRFVYNWGLQNAQDAYKETKATKRYSVLSRELTILKRAEEYKWLREAPAESLQESLKQLDAAYENFFNLKTGFPKFKSKRSSRLSCKFVNHIHFDFDGNQVRVPKLEWVKFCPNQTFDASHVRTGGLTVFKDKCGEYWCTVIVDTLQNDVPKAKIHHKRAIGIDLGLKDFAVLSDGTRIVNPRDFEKQQKRLKRAQQRFSRTKKDSKRHEAARLKVAKIYRSIHNKHYDFLQKLSTELVQKYDAFCVEDLDIKGMMERGHLARSMRSVSWGEFIRQLSYKSQWRGKHVITIPRSAPSSKTCSNCGCVYRDLQLKERMWTCGDCGVTHDRDVNAAVNIKNIGLRQ